MVDVSMRYLDYYTAAFAGRWDMVNAKRRMVDVSMRYLDYYTAAFAGRWDMVNAKRGYPWEDNPWEDNPWVWVYEFKLERVVK